MWRRNAGSQRDRKINALKRYAKRGADRSDGQLLGFIEKHSQHGAAQEHGSISRYQQYDKKIDGIPIGRRYPKGESMKTITREARFAALVARPAPVSRFGTSGRPEIYKERPALEARSG